MGQGYSGLVTLVSPDGREGVTVQLPGRVWSRYDENGRYLDEPRLDVRNPGDGRDRKTRRRQDRRFRRLLSQGWRVATEKDEVGEEQKKHIDLIIGTTQTGLLSHGGDHASGEVKDSPNRAKKRGNRGGRPKSAAQREERKRKRNSKTLRLQLRNAGGGGAGIYCPQPLRVHPKMQESAEESAKLLGELVGRSAQKTLLGTTVDTEQFLVALETGDNPIPPLEVPRERPRIRVLVTPDCSGSTQNWSGLGRAWALFLSKLPDTDVIYLENYNGEFWGVAEEDVATLLQNIDLLIYLGDGDGHNLCHQYAEKGATVVALDCYCANWARPRLSEVSPKKSGGCLYWVDRASAKEPTTWYEALKLVLGQ